MSVDYNVNWNTFLDAANQTTVYGLKNYFHAVEGVNPGRMFFLWDFRSFLRGTIATPRKLRLSQSVTTTAGNSTSQIKIYAGVTDREKPFEEISADYDALGAAPPNSFTLLDTLNTDPPLTWTTGAASILEIDIDAAVANEFLGRWVMLEIRAGSTGTLTIATRHNPIESPPHFRLGAFSFPTTLYPASTGAAATCGPSTTEVPFTTLAPEDVVSKIVSWTVTASMKGAYGGSATLVNDTHLLGSEDSLRTLECGLLLDGEDFCRPSGISSTTEYPNTAKNWLYGPVTNIDEGEDSDPNSGVTLTVASFTSRLRETPVENMWQIPGRPSNALTALFQDFAGMKPAHFDFSGLSDTSNFEKVQIQGKNILEEAKLLARASGADLFVNEVGLLVAEDWKGNTDPVEFLIPQAAIISAQKAGPSNIGPSQITVKGRPFAEKEEPGTSDAPEDPPKPKGGRRPIANKIGGEKFCLLHAVPGPQGQIRIHGQFGGGDGGVGEHGGSLDNANYDKSGSLVDVESLVDNQATANYDTSGAEDSPDILEVRVALEAPGQFRREYVQEVGVLPGPMRLPKEDLDEDVVVADQLAEGEFVLEGEFDRDLHQAANEILDRDPALGPKRKRVVEVFEGPDGKLIQVVEEVEEEEEEEKKNKRGRGRPPGGGGGGRGGSPQTPSDVGESRDPKTADSLSENRVHCVLSDPALIREYGVRKAVIDNKYVPNVQRACALAQRVFDEFKMARRAWTLTTVYMPCIELNQVVKFTPPNRSTPVVGLLTQVSLNYDATQPEASMSLVVESFEDV